MRSVAYRLYGWMLRRQLAGGPVPRHVAMVMDGNRRWARQQGYEDTRVGHRRGGEHLEEVLGWCAEAGIRHVTVFVASIDNLRKRDAGEVGYLMTVIEDVVADRLARGSGRWRLHVAGRPDTLPPSTAHALKEAVDATAARDTDSHLTIAVGYDGREEVTEAVRALLTDAAAAGTGIDELAQTLTVEDIAGRLYTADRPDPDLVIRTSGEQRISAGFLMWQAAHSELYFCDVYWPGFRHVDFLRALRAYAARRRRS
jgi:short-chain Z-isoprenyl diphosphate synthase